MKYSENAINILTAKIYKRIGPATLIKRFKESGFFNSLEEFESKKKNITQKILQLEEYIDGIVAIGDEDFPWLRGKVPETDQPVALFYRGNLSLLKENNKNIAVIGLRDPDKHTEIIEKKVVAELIKNGATIVSGLALGCDSIAHQQALDSHGKTIAILPSSLDDILPASNKKLANEIVENDGLLITEYYEKFTFNNHSRYDFAKRYIDRDRLQALFSDGIILSASYAKGGKDSGSRYAMEAAKKYSIPRAIIYNANFDKDNPKYALNRQYIKEEPEITIINQDNLVSKVRKIITSKPKIKTNRHEFQKGLFD